MPDDIQTCHDLARSRVGESMWNMMSTREQAIAIYAELRRFDLSRAADPEAAERSPQGLPECERLAKQTETPSAREMLLYVAARWRAMAEADE
jgi:hypothetical protein